MRYFMIRLKFRGKCNLSFFFYWKQRERGLWGLKQPLKFFACDIWRSQASSSANSRICDISLLPRGTSLLFPSLASFPIRVSSKFFFNGRSRLRHRRIRGNRRILRLLRLLVSFPKKRTIQFAFFSFFFFSCFSLLKRKIHDKDNWIKIRKWICF